jgi:glycogen debranching enzyme
VTEIHLEQGTLQMQTSLSLHMIYFPFSNKDMVHLRTKLLSLPHRKMTYNYNEADNAEYFYPPNRLHNKNLSVLSFILSPLAY